ncbi:hypothetical protein BOX15_Mlig020206g1 [Macrostomum lignano]|uniref:Delta-like protein n=1 Tax=Macrostomum lignano TaxID=282301 RepID=A0A267E305_9PLAT|nr:hypothetical protein BOX15_Mlig020206g1 [Macrostomum lignano]
MHSLLCLLLTGCCLIVAVNCHGYMTIKFQQYHNHDSRCSDGTYCDTILFFNSRESACDPHFHLTADRYNAGGNGLFDHSQSGWYWDKDVIDFGSDFAGIKNPVVIAMNFDNNDGRLFIRVIVHDKDSTADDLIDIFSATLEASGPDAKDLTIVSHAMGHTLRIRYWYSCHSGYYGALCNTYCMEKNNAWDGHYTCGSDGQKVCRSGWIGADCKTPHPCSTGVCQNGATCVPNGDSYSCRCPADYSGTNCETFLNPCTYRNPCKNGATCVLNGDSYSCRCPADYSGTNCETFLNPCTYRNPCKNGATCQLDAGRQPQCRCLPQFTGSHCELDVDECSTESPCSNDMPCVNIHGGFYCNCTDAKLHGSLCEFDRCNTTVCLNSGICHVNETDGVPRCLCPEGFLGENCEIDNPCYSSPCQNGAPCRNSAVGFACDCPPDFIGDRCETAKPNYCASGPCRNGGDCVSGTDGFSCTCPTGFKGALCERFASEGTPKSVGQVGENPGDASTGNSSVVGVAAGCAVGFLLLIALGVFLGVYLLRRRRNAGSEADLGSSIGHTNEIYNNASEFTGTVRSYDPTVQWEDEPAVYEAISGLPVGEPANQLPVGGLENSAYEEDA